jgi:hypothetical protein
MRAALRDCREPGVKTSSRTTVHRARYWWQARTMAGLTVGWIAIALGGWRICAALIGSHA